MALERLAAMTGTEAGDRRIESSERPFLGMYLAKRVSKARCGYLWISEYCCERESASTEIQETETGGRRSESTERPFLGIHLERRVLIFFEEISENCSGLECALTEIQESEAGGRRSESSGRLFLGYV